MQWFGLAYTQDVVHEWTRLVIICRISSLSAVLLCCQNPSGSTHTCACTFKGTRDEQHSCLRSQESENYKDYVLLLLVILVLIVVLLVLLLLKLVLLAATTTTTNAPLLLLPLLLLLCEFTVSLCLYSDHIHWLATLWVIPVQYTLILNSSFAMLILNLGYPVDSKPGVPY